MPNRSVVQSDAGFAWDEGRKQRPWSDLDLDRLMASLRAMIRTHEPLDCLDGTTRATFDGRAYWQLLAALDRESS